MALLHILHQLAPRYSWRLTVAHLNHCLRGRSSDADEHFVIRVAAKLELPVVTSHADLKQLARAEKLSIEMAARKARHDFLAQTAKRLKISTIALAHHADDQVELFFLRLLRGSGSDGLSGMKWRSRSPSDPRITIIRPLLDQPKAVALQFLAESRIRFREDASNRSPDFQRNRIRHELLPLLRQNFQPALERVVARSIEIIGAEGDFVLQTARDWLVGKVPLPFEKLRVAVQRRVLQVQLFQSGVPAEFGWVETLRIQPDCLIEVRPGVFVKRDHEGQVRLHHPMPRIVESGAQLKVLLNGLSGRVLFDKIKIEWRISETQRATKPGPGAGREIFDADKVGASVVLRHWVPGDRFQPIGMPASVKLQDLFTNQKIRREQRCKLVVATAQAGELFWVEKLRISEGFKVSDQTIRRLHWHWKPI